MAITLVIPRYCQQYTHIWWLPYGGSYPTKHCQHHIYISNSYNQPYPISDPHGFHTDAATSNPNTHYGCCEVRISVWLVIYIVLGVNKMFIMFCGVPTPVQGVLPIIAIGEPCCAELVIVGAGGYVVRPLWMLRGSYIGMVGYTHCSRCK